jgi:hypothetical protein
MAYAHRAPREKMGMGSDWDEPLQALRWHWGSAYIINCARLGRWTAERRDTHERLRDETPLGLRDKIIADYTARPVSRDLPDQPGPWARRSAPREQDQKSTI